MGCCCQDRTERHDHREERLTALRRMIDEARGELAELDDDKEEAA